MNAIEFLALLKEKFGGTGNYGAEESEITCAKCLKPWKMLTAWIRSIVKPGGLLAFLRPIKITFTFQAQYHPACGFSKFVVVELAGLQKALRNVEEVKGFLEILVNKYLLGK